MKTQVKYHIAAILFVGLGLTGFQAEAQRNSSRQESKKEYKYTQKRTNRNDRQNSRYATPQGQRSQREYSGRNYSEHKNYNSKAYKKQHQNKAYHSKKGYSNSHHSHYKHQYNDRYAYTHPHYGQVYRRFHSAPVRLHHAHGNFYWHSGYYYQYHPHVGYVRCAPPRNYVFVDLPGQYVAVNHGGHVYFRVGDLYFERCSGGYRVAPQVDISFSLHL